MRFKLGNHTIESFLLININGGGGGKPLYNLLNSILSLLKKLSSHFICAFDVLSKYLFGMHSLFVPVSLKTGTPSCIPTNHIHNILFGNLRLYTSYKPYICFPFVIKAKYYFE